jgi:hypothetical protein
MGHMCVYTYCRLAKRWWLLLVDMYCGTALAAKTQHHAGSMMLCWTAALLWAPTAVAPSPMLLCCTCMPTSSVWQH